jgi:hypothetical protein
MKRLAALVLTALASTPTSCLARPPNTLLICHNANCADPGTSDRDDNLDALSASLALRIDGRPVLDGAEIDSAWDAASGRCLFAHGPSPEAPDLSEATRLLAAHLSQPGDVSWNRERFYVKIELKPDVGSGNDHSLADAEHHADCMLDQLAVLEGAARGAGHALTVIFDSADPVLLRAITQRPRWTGKHTGEAVEVKFEVGFDSSVPSDFDLEVDILTVRWSEIDSGMRDEFAARGKDGLAWGRDPAPETLGKLVDLAPRYIGSNDALMMRRWLSGR